MTVPDTPSAPADADAAADSLRGAFFGRRKGKRLRDRQADLISDLLPRLRLPEAGPLTPNGLFGRPVDDVWIEIGFGGGEHLIARALADRGKGIIGFEPFINGMAKLLGRVADEGIDNVRLHDADAIPVLARLPAASIGQAFILYPDPWPKRRHRKRRIISDETLSLLARIIRPGGLLRFATDIDDYAAWTLARLDRSPDFIWQAERADDWREPWPGWLSTRYEQKAFREGRRPSYITAVRR
ncbi:tRNA (guanine-N7-)-methyltransferase [Pseudochelatococcus lubricantis]|uniref:tRNA (guanine-N(7)-)-methyltransferase n=1 Tax=Pseudochelatococcus lubricantis TaxID=1538102 RepID=A0ABX0UVL6_9HYPH|nr:tRNA (guanine(46)-N(7))-methyltransferase TrmB [Pseudochelatococcus lubricantis]NIJ57003.1 tRNA (guanine-N7-)-methyltransferase [Pseudochelatococcus lubricantis]